MELQLFKSTFPIPKDFQRIIQKEMEAANRKTFRRGVVLNFKDPSYSFEEGGFHPVEVGINEEGQIIYITDFAYVGSPPFVELTKSLDFAFEYDVFQQGGFDYPIDNGKQLFSVFINNFCVYHDMGVFKEVTVSSLY